MNIVAMKLVFVTVACFPQVRKHFVKSAPAKAAAALAEVVQRTLALGFRKLMQASHLGAEMTPADGSVAQVSPRVFLYVSDKPEERDVLCLKRHGSAFDCTPCMAPSKTYGVRWAAAPRARNFLKAVGQQLRGAAMRRKRGNGVLIEQ